MAIQSENYSSIVGPPLKELPHPKSFLPILLKDGAKLSRVTPRAFFTTSSKEPDKKSLTISMLYEDENNKPATINVDRISGLEVVAFGDELYIKTTYYQPQTNTLEPEPRLLKIKDIMHGVHPNHAKVHEKPDFYIVADDKKRLDEGKTGAEAERNFPFWRLGIYGDPKEAQKIFQPNTL